MCPLLEVSQYLIYLSPRVAPLPPCAGYRVQITFTRLPDHMPQTRRGSSPRRSPIPNAAQETPTLRQRSQELRKLSSAAIEWDGTAAAKAESGRLTFAEIYRQVHRNEVDGIDFQFDQFTQAEKEHLIMRGAPLSAVTRDRAAQFASSTSGDRDFKPVSYTHLTLPTTD